MQAEFPGVPVCLDHLRFPAPCVSSSPWVTSRLRTKGWKFEPNFHGVGWIHVDGLHLAAQAFVPEQGVHHHQRVTQNQPVDPTRFWCSYALSKPIVNRQVALPKQIETCPPDGRGYVP